MVNLIIDGRNVQVEEGTSILEAAKRVGVKIPTLCYLKGVNEIGACRACLVEIEGIDRLVASCDNVCTEGMVVHTNTARVFEARRTNVELLLSQHRVECPSCERNETCQLKKVAYDMGARSTDSYKNEYILIEWEKNVPIIRDESKCIKCYRCVSECEKVQTVNIWDMIGSGTHTSVGVQNHVKLSDSGCVFCGQCVTHCPTNALSVRNDISKVGGFNGGLNNPEKVTVVQIAPAVRTAWGEDFGLSPEQANEKVLAAVLRRIGFDYVFDTNFSADLTIMEEGTEFLERFTHKDQYPWPMFTSCCPGWVRFVKTQFPEFTGNLSTAKSPQQMFGAVTKTYFAENIGVAPENIYCVSIMPCSAKKAEMEIPNINDAAEGVKDVDCVLTTRELCRLIKAKNIDVAAIEEEEFDSPLGTGSGAAVIFGATGGVMEAALRTCYYILTGENPNADETFKAVRASNSDKPWVEAEYNVAGNIVKAAVVNSLGNTRKLLNAIKDGEVEYDFVEVMACPGGCVGGGGQPIHYNEEWAADRAKVVYNYDAKNVLRFSHENPEIQTLYADFLKEPCSERSHHLLHTDHFGWEAKWEAKDDN
ncbi:MAG: [FeFe] hydrogenase, group A [Lachnospiraceae bacterium]|nr:[FeFe] hydrogenase, group A [Lachnospiraceae bacterium]